MNVSRRRVGWLAGIATAVTLAGLACKDSAAPVAGPRLDEVPCVDECPPGPPTFALYAAPALYNYGICYIQEEDGGTETTVGALCNETFEGQDETFDVGYKPLVQGQPAVSAVYELTYYDATHYQARFLDAQLYNGQDRVRHTITVHFDPNAVGIRIRSFNDVCPTVTTDALACWQAATFGHDELHICIENSGPGISCQAGLGADASRALATVTQSSNDCGIDLNCRTFQVTATNRHPQALAWDRKTVSNDCTTVLSDWQQGGTGPTFSTSNSGLVWTQYVRVRASDEPIFSNAANFNVMKVSGLCN
jgi:hypothetical protein